MGAVLKIAYLTIAKQPDRVNTVGNINNDLMMFLSKENRVYTVRFSN